MRIAHVGGFDAAGTAWNLSHAIRSVTPLHESYSLLGTRSALPCTAVFSEERDKCLEILRAADAVVLHCGIHDWDTERPLVACEPNWLGVDTHEVPLLKEFVSPERAVIWLDGSVAVRHNVGRWKERYAGYRICATNPDVADLYGAEWLPACVSAAVDEGLYQKPAALRHPRVVAHPYTDIGLKGHGGVCRAVDGLRPAWDLRPIQGLAHGDCLAAMAEADLVVDHFQGYFGVVSMEATAAGKPVLLNVSRQTALAMTRYGWPVPSSWLHCEGEGAILAWLAALDVAPADLWEEFFDLARSWHTLYGRNADKAERFLAWLLRS